MSHTNSCRVPVRPLTAVPSPCSMLGSTLAEAAPSQPGTVLSTIIDEFFPNANLSNHTSLSSNTSLPSSTSHLHMRYRSRRPHTARSAGSNVYSICKARAAAAQTLPFSSNCNATSLSLVSSLTSSLAASSRCISPSPSLPRCDSSVFPTCVSLPSSIAIANDACMLQQQRNKLVLAAQQLYQRQLAAYECSQRSLSHEHELKQQLESMKEFTNEVIEKNRWIQETKQDMKESLEQHVQQTQQYSNENQQLKQTIQELKNKMCLLRGDHAPLLQAHTSLQVQHRQLKERLDLLERINQQLANEKQTIHFKNNELAQNISILENKHSSLHSRHCDGQQDLFLLESKHSALQQSQSQLQAEHATLHKQIQHMQTTHNTLKQSYDSLQQQYQSSLHDLNISKALLDNKSQLYQQLEVKLHNHMKHFDEKEKQLCLQLENEIKTQTTMKSKYDEIKSEKEHLFKEYNECKADMALFKEDKLQKMSKLKDDKLELQFKYHKLFNSYQQLNSEISKLTSNMLPPTDSSQRSLMRTPTFTFQQAVSLTNINQSTSSNTNTNTASLEVMELSADRATLDHPTNPSTPLLSPSSSSTHSTPSSSVASSPHSSRPNSAVRQPAPAHQHTANQNNSSATSASTSTTAGASTNSSIQPSTTTSAAPTPAPPISRRIPKKKSIVRKTSTIQPSGAQVEQSSNNMNTPNIPNTPTLILPVSGHTPSPLFSPSSASSASPLFSPLSSPLELPPTPSLHDWRVNIESLQHEVNTYKSEIVVLKKEKKEQIMNNEQLQQKHEQLLKQFKEKEYEMELLQQEHNVKMLISSSTISSLQHSLSTLQSEFDTCSIHLSEQRRLTAQLQADIQSAVEREKELENVRKLEQQQYKYDIDAVKGELSSMKRQAERYQDLYEKFLKKSQLQTEELKIERERAQNEKDKYEKLFNDKQAEKQLFEEKLNNSLTRYNAFESKFVTLQHRFKSFVFRNCASYMRIQQRDAQVMELHNQISKLTNEIHLNQQHYHVEKNALMERIATLVSRHREHEEEISLLKQDIHKRGKEKEEMEKQIAMILLEQMASHEAQMHTQPDRSRSSTPSFKE